MTLKTEGVYASEFLMSEAPGNYSRGTGVIDASQEIKPGTVLGKITNGARTAAGAAGVPAPAGATITAVPVAALNTKLGAHRFECIVGGAGGASRWRHTDPDGKFVGVAAAAIAYAGGGLSVLTITDAAADPTPGEAFTVTVIAAAASGRYVRVAPAALDGSATAAAVALRGVTTGIGETAEIAIVERAAEVKSALLDTGALDNGQIATAVTDLAAAGIIARG
jgi:hypothetical protein